MPITITPMAPKRDRTANWVLTTIDSNAVTSGHQIQYPRDGKLLLVITNSAAATKGVAILAGDGIHKGQGSYSFTLAANNGSVVLGPLSSSRFKDKDGYIQIVYGSGMTGNIAAVRYP